MIIKPKIKFMDILCYKNSNQLSNLPEDTEYIVICGFHFNSYDELSLIRNNINLPIGLKAIYHKFQLDDVSSLFKLLPLGCQVLPFEIVRVGTGIYDGLSCYSCLTSIQGINLRDYEVISYKYIDGCEGTLKTSKGTNDIYMITLKEIINVILE